MQITVEPGDITNADAPCVVVNLFEGVTAPGGATGAVDRALDGMISELIASGDVRGKWGEMTLVHTFGRIPSPRVLIAGLGKSGEFTVDRVRDLSAAVAKHLRARRVERFSTIVHGGGIAGLDAEACAQAIAEGAVLGLYRFDRHKKPDEDAGSVEAITIVERDTTKVAALRAAAARGAIVAEAANFARDLANEPANVLTPTELAVRAEAMAREHGLGCHIYDRDWAEQMGMGSFLGVARGSAQPPRFIVLTYRGAGEATPLGLVGKGITFDTGGISIKPAQGMEEMKGDMSGAACVIAAMKAIAELQPAINVTAIAPATENMPGGNATKPGDVVRAMNGKTIEVINTDAEGRLILADALAYACKLDLSPVVDVATLTGAISITLGDVAYGVMTNNDGLLERVRAASATAGEKCWQLPMFPEYKENIKSNIADMKNSGGRGAGSINAAMLLKEFVDDRPWAHLDIAGVDFFDKEKGVLVKGASGIPVRTLVQLALDLAERPL
ncbi:MAG: leucyl aminopeptidase [Dehalococcoidia bacterium]|nr:MAG: leucyl aminopeptidase [Dehalococcoidia bacterium]